MTEAEQAALAALRFDWAPVPDDVWRPSPFHVEGLHRAVVRDVLRGVADARDSADASPIGLVLQGQRGSGKTHLLGWVRQQVQQQGGYFFLVGLLDAHGFWDSVLAALVDGLSRPVPGSESQLRLLLRRLSSLVGAPRSARRAVMGDTTLTRAALDAFIEGLAGHDPYVARTCRETARALALSASEEFTHRDIAENYFASGEEGEPGERAAWGMRRTPRGAQQIVQELSWLLALTGPSVVAVDQIDTLIAQSVAAGDVLHARSGAPDDPEQAAVHARIADGLMSLRQVTRRTLTLVACLPTSWTIIGSRTVDTVTDRFRTPPRLSTIHDAALARELVERRLAARFADLGFVPPYPSWPVRPEAFAQAEGMTPRQLLIDIDRHIRACLDAGEVRELTRLGDPAAPRPPGARTAPEADLDRFDARFAQLKGEVDVSGPLTRDSEDSLVPGLLAAGLTAWVMERGEGGPAFSVDPPPSAQPPLHARLRLTLDETTEDQAHWCFRAISAEHHAVAALARLRKACTVAGLDARITRRRLFLLRNGDWSSGIKTRQAVTAFTRAGGTVLPLDAEDLRILGALQVLLAEAPVDVRGWLTARRPTRDLTVLRLALASVADWLPDTPGEVPATTATLPEPPAPVGTGPVDATPVHAGPVEARPGEAGPVEARPGEAGPVDDGGSGPHLTVGYDHRTGDPVPLSLEALRKHTTIFAGSGSGKTVLIRRILEECALAGVSAIVLDPNNDLARLGDEWPEPPSDWRAGDAEKARDYLTGTDVRVWTPRRSSGRPLSFQPLPDFRSVLDDPDEFHEAVEAAVASLAPRAQLTGRTSKVHLGLAVLRKAVEHYGRRGGSRVQGLIDTLADLPDGLLDIDGADKIGVWIAQSLAAAMVNDPLFGGEGSPVDPGLLLTPEPGRRARISVVSLVGLQSDEARQGFVNQLQMALFAWIKRHPANDRPLLGLLVMDEAQTFAPSGAMTACTQSTLALAAQARKYGLGLIFATQSPKGLHNRIPGNAATQLYGRLNSPIQLEAAREMAKAKGGDVADISRLSTGEFYLAAEGAAPVKIRTPLSLSHHPRSPLTAEEVLDRARRR
ncbi:ATP-binding protein [Micromonospora sp. WMMD714]|uniref:ATP-binding protein n=2 Tax=Micromonospora sp. WMMD714 TaxID=3016097 RepID=UPI00249A2D8A|nr:ATP-binding protein [Micromonospora sp. WMMD714]WFE67293.1 ATP-binding protein [Micromonospora sp. WMMD714]